MSCSQQFQLKFSRNSFAPPNGTHASSWCHMEHTLDAAHAVGSWLQTFFLFLSNTYIPGMIKVVVFLLITITHKMHHCCSMLPPLLLLLSFFHAWPFERTVEKVWYTAVYTQLADSTAGAISSTVNQKTWSFCYWSTHFGTSFKLNQTNESHQNNIITVI